ncbi:PAS domain-containing protein [Stigmatella aurantiaca]|uniref:PAS domain-containing protein n=1 Tax=Stigmatella aurantiaca TaxID=41 RepID=UPI0011D20F05|nr:PAS domain-containing protein [Stigmatella aurantiaca]
MSLDRAWLASREEMDEDDSATGLESETGRDEPVRGGAGARSGKEGELVRRLMRVPMPALAVMDAAGRVVDANDSFLRLGGVGREDLEAGRMRWDALAAPESPAAGAQAMDMLRRLGTAGPLRRSTSVRTARGCPCCWRR